MRSDPTMLRFNSFTIDFIVYFIYILGICKCMGCDGFIQRAVKLYYFILYFLNAAAFEIWKYKCAGTKLRLHLLFSENYNYKYMIII